MRPVAVVKDFSDFLENREKLQSLQVYFV